MTDMKGLVDILESSELELQKDELLIINSFISEMDTNRSLFGGAASSMFCDRIFGSC